MAQRQALGYGVKWGVAHNSYVEMAAELGVPGILFFVAFIFTTFQLLLRVDKVEGLQGGGARGPPHLAQPIMASMVGFLVGAFFLSLGYHAMMYTLAAIAVGLAKVTLNGPASRPRSRVHQPVAAMSRRRG
jgi:O-antigen ligase